MCEKQRDKESNYPDQCGSVGWAPPHATKRHQLVPGQGTGLGCGPGP